MDDLGTTLRKALAIWATLTGVTLVFFVFSTLLLKAGFDDSVALTISLAASLALSIVLISGVQRTYFTPLKREKQFAELWPWHMLMRILVLRGAPRLTIHSLEASMTNDQSKQTVNENKAGAEVTADLSKEVIQYLSKEIETTTNTMMVFRSKIGFAVLVGPFLILGVLASRGLGLSLNFDRWAVIASLTGVACYLTLAVMSGRIEEDAWEQCNKWRQLIADLHAEPGLRIGRGNVWKDDKHSKKMTSSYLAAYAVLLLLFLCLVTIISRVQPTRTASAQTETNLASPTPTNSARSERKE